VLLISRLARQGSAALLLAGALIALDVSAFAAQFLTISGPGTDVEARDTLARVRAGRVLSLCQQSITPNSMIGLRVPTVDGYNSAFLRRYADFASLVQGGEIGESHAAFPKIGTAGSLRRPKLVDALNVTHIHSCSELDDRFPVVATTSTWKLYENPGALPRAYLVCQAERVTTPNRAARSMRDSKFDPSRQAVIIASDPGAAALPSLDAPCPDSGSVDVLDRDTPGGDLTVNVRSPRPSLLVIADAYYPEREAWVDGVNTEVVPTNLALSGVPLSSGSHRIELRYVPTSLYLGTAITGFTALLWLCGYLIVRRTRMRTA
jgi:hypothetical protein